MVNGTRQAIFWLPAALFLLALGAWLWMAFGPQARDEIEVRITSAEEIVLRGYEGPCPHRFLPDAPARAFRDGQGQIQLTVAHQQTYRMVGPTLDRLVLRCEPIFSSDAEPDPALFSDREWLSSVYALDGQRVVALVHMEYQGNEHPGQCPTRRYEDCWYNAITLALSEDGGRSFAQPTPPNHLVASLPERYRPSEGPAGMFTPSNIVLRPEDGRYYAMVQVIPYGDGQWGTCVMRTRDPTDPSSWRAWNGESFTHGFRNPYVDTADGTIPEDCEVVSPREIQGMSHSLTYNLYLERFLLVGIARRIDPRTRNVRAGIFYSLSEDLIRWKPRRPLLEAEVPWTFDCGDPDPINFPSVIDPLSESRNFETSSRRIYLYFTRIHMQGCRQTGERDLVRVPIEFNKR